MKSPVDVALYDVRNAVNSAFAAGGGVLLERTDEGWRRRSSRAMACQRLTPSRTSSSTTVSGSSRSGSTARSALGVTNSGIESGV